MVPSVQPERPVSDDSAASCALLSRRHVAWAMWAGLPDGGGCGGLLTSMELMGHALLARLADAVLDLQSSEGGFEDVHVGLRVWGRVESMR